MHAASGASVRNLDNIPEMADFRPPYTRYDDLASFRGDWCSNLFDWDVTPRAGAYQGALFSRRHEDVVYSDIIFGACRADRKIGHIGRHDEYIGINLFLCGQAEIHQHGQAETVTAGDLFLWDVSSPTHFTTRAETRCLNIFLPRAVMDRRALSLRHFLGRRVGREHELSPLLLSHLLTLHRVIDALSEKGREDALRMTLDILSSGFKPDDALPDAYSYLRRNFVRITGLIDDNLSNEDFSASQCAAMLGLSDRYMRRVMAQFSVTFSSYIRKRRLECAADALRSRAFSRNSVTEIAASFGFSDPSYFARLFAKEYGRSPSEFRS